MNDPIRRRLLPPPRPISILLRLQVLLGGILTQIGLAFLGFGVLVSSSIAVNTDYKSYLYFRGELERVGGNVTGWEKTSMTENETPIYAIYYTFKDQEEEKRKGISYKLGGYIRAGSPVVVEYPQGNSEISRIQELRTGAFGPIALLVTIFPFVGLLMTVLGLRKGLRESYLLGRGELARGKLIDKEATGEQINNQRVYKMTFEFQTRSGRTQRATIKTHLTELLEDDEEELLLYAPRKPHVAAAVDTLPGAPQIDRSGTLKAQSPLSGLARLVIPTLALGANVVYFAFFF